MRALQVFWQAVWLQCHALCVSRFGRACPLWHFVRWVRLGSICFIDGVGSRSFTPSLIKFLHASLTLLIGCRPPRIDVWFVRSELGNSETTLTVNHSSRNVHDFTELSFNVDGFETSNQLNLMFCPVRVLNQKNKRWETIYPQFQPARVCFIRLLSLYYCC